MTILNAILFEMKHNFILTNEEEALLFNEASSQFSSIDVVDNTFSAACWVDNTVGELIASE